MSELTGKCKFFSEQKGYGFIKDDDSENEYFVHITNVIDRIQENDEVSFDLADGKKGKMATNVKIIN